VLFLPVESAAEGKQWLALSSDYNHVQLFLMSAPSTPAHSFQLDQVTVDIFCTEINFWPLVKADKPLHTFSFPVTREVQVWRDAVGKRGVDPLYSFIACLPFVLLYQDAAPPPFWKQIRDAVVAPDLAFFHTFASVASSRGQEIAKPAVLSALSLMAESGYLAPFYRAVFGIEIAQLRGAQTIFRESSAASITSGAFMVTVGADFVTAVADLLLASQDSLDTAIREFMKLKEKLPSAIRIVFASCFRATRRRYQEKMVPVLAVSSFLMLRFLLPQFAIMSPIASRMGQKVMQAFVFKKFPPDQVREDVYELMARFLLEISQPEPAKVTMAPHDIKKIFQFTAENAIGMIERLQPLNAELDHPLHWSILELLEGVVFGIGEDFGRILSAGTIQL
jgi:hypothetical protein